MPESNMRDSDPLLTEVIQENKRQRGVGITHPLDHTLILQKLTGNYDSYSVIAPILYTDVRNIAHVQDVSFSQTSQNKLNEGMEVIDAMFGWMQYLDPMYDVILLADYLGKKYDDDYLAYSKTEDYRQNRQGLMIFEGFFSFALGVEGFVGVDAIQLFKEVVATSRSAIKGIARILNEADDISDFTRAVSHVDFGDEVADLSKADDSLGGVCGLSFKADTLVMMKGEEYATCGAAVDSEKTAEESVGSLKSDVSQVDDELVVCEEDEQPYTYDQKPIQDIETGDYVWSFNEVTQKPELNQVLQTLNRKASDIISIKIKGEEILTTFGHPFYVSFKQDGMEKKCWAAALDLIRMMKNEPVPVENDDDYGSLYTSCQFDSGSNYADVSIFSPFSKHRKKGGFDDSTDHGVKNLDENYTPIQDISFYDEIGETDVYNFEVANAHNYYVSKNLWLTHNPGGGGCRPGGKKKSLFTRICG